MLTRLRRRILIPVVKFIAPSKSELGLIEFISRENLSAIALFRLDGWKEILFRDLTLSSQDLVCVFGAYLGDSIYDYRTRFDVSIVGLEPVSEYQKHLSGRFKNDVKVQILPIGVSDRDESIRIELSDDGTSFYKNGGSSEIVNCTDVVNLLDSFDQIPKIIEINIEGSEFRVLKRLLASHHAKSIRTLIIQFHDFVEDSELQRAEIRKTLSENYDEFFCYPFVWERWDRKSD